MSNAIQEAKRKLPLPALMHRLGLGEHSKKSARCPFHEDKHNSFSVWQNGDGWAFKCHAGCGAGDEINFLELHEKLSRGDAVKRFLELAGLNGSAPYVLRPNETKQAHSALDWRARVDAFTPKHLERLAKWRGYSPEFCSWLKQQEFIGLYDGCVAFPVHDESGRVVGAHCRVRGNDNSWYYTKGVKLRPLVIGKLHSGDTVHAFESTWDGLDFMDKSGERGGIIITRGAKNGRLVAGTLPERAVLYLWPQNDGPSEDWAKDVSARVKCEVKRVKIPAPYKDLNDWTRAGATAGDLLAAMVNAETMREAEKPLIEFRSPLQLKNFTPPPGFVLVGDCHVVRGSVFVIGGAPGVGKSRGAVALAVAGATGSDWFGLTVHRRFKTMIIQSENGLFRLSKEFAGLDCDRLEAFVRVSPPPQFGMCFSREDFRAQLSTAIREFGPDIIIFDPWNAAARDDKAREYLETFELIRSVLPAGDNAPALGIVAHTRKPRTDERATGRGLLNVLVGSYVLGSVPRCVFVMQIASDDPQDNRVVWTCCKNNDGELGVRSAWERRNGLFAPVSDFDWDSFDNPNQNDRVTITSEDMATVFENGDKQLTRNEAFKALEALTEAGRTACYTALRPDGRFTKQLLETNGLLSWKP
jgi:AAA domain/CHC2 zinc finger